MLQWFKNRSDAGRTAGELYGSVVTAARQPFFYKDLGVPDTPEGRFELVALHLFLALEPINKSAESASRLTQRTIETFVTDMDDCMREMGVGDMVVGKKVKRAAAAFYDRASAYRRALAGDVEPGLDALLKRYVYASDPPSQTSVAALSAYVRKTAAVMFDVPAGGNAVGAEDVMRRLGTVTA